MFRHSNFFFRMTVLVLALVCCQVSGGSPPVNILDISLVSTLNRSQRSNYTLTVTVTENGFSGWILCLHRPTCYHFNVTLPVFAIRDLELKQPCSVLERLWPSIQDTGILQEPDISLLHNIECRLINKQHRSKWQVFFQLQEKLQSRKNQEQHLRRKQIQKASNLQKYPPTNYLVIHLQHSLSRYEQELKQKREMPFPKQGHLLGQEHNLGGNEEYSAPRKQGHLGHEQIITLSDSKSLHVPGQDQQQMRGVQLQEQIKKWFPLRDPIHKAHKPMQGEFGSFMWLEQQQYVHRLRQATRLSKKQRRRKFMEVPGQRQAKDHTETFSLQQESHTKKGQSQVENLLKQKQQRQFKRSALHERDGSRKYYNHQREKSQWQKRLQMPKIGFSIQQQRPNRDKDITLAQDQQQDGLAGRKKKQEPLHDFSSHQQLHQNQNYSSSFRFPEQNPSLVYLSSQYQKKQQTEKSKRDISSLLSQSFDRSDNGLEGEAKKGLEGEANEGLEGVANEGLEGEANEGLEGKANEGLEGEAKKGLEGEANEGLEGDANKGLEGEAKRGLEGEAKEGLKGEAKEGLKGEAKEGLEGEAKKGLEGEAKKGVEGEVKKGLEGEAKEGLECEVKKGLEGEAKKGLEGEVKKGLEGEVKKGLEGEAKKGLEGEANNGLEGEAKEGLEGEAKEGLEGEVKKGFEGEAKKGLEGEAKKGLEGEVKKRLEGEAKEGLEGEAKEGLEGEAKKGLEGEAKGGLEGEVMKGLEGEAKKGLEGEAKKGLERETNKGLEGEAKKGLEGESNEGLEGESNEGLEGEAKKGLEGQFKKDLEGHTKKPLEFQTKKYLQGLTKKYITSKQPHEFVATQEDLEGKSKKCVEGQTNRRLECQTKESQEVQDKEEITSKGSQEEKQKSKMRQISPGQMPPKRLKRNILLKEHQQKNDIVLQGKSYILQQQQQQMESRLHHQQQQMHHKQQQKSLYLQQVYQKQQQNQQLFSRPQLQQHRLQQDELNQRWISQKVNAKKKLMQRSNRKYPRTQTYLWSSNTQESLQEQQGQHVGQSTQQQQHKQQQRQHVGQSVKEMFQRQQSHDRGVGRVLSSHINRLRFVRSLTQDGLATYQPGQIAMKSLNLRNSDSHSSENAGKENDSKQRYQRLDNILGYHSRMEKPFIHREPDEFDQTHSEYLETRNREQTESEIPEMVKSESSKEVEKQMPEQRMLTDGSNMANIRTKTSDMLEKILRRRNAVQLVQSTEDNSTESFSSETVPLHNKRRGGKNFPVNSPGQKTNYQTVFDQEKRNRVESKMLLARRRRIQGRMEKSHIHDRPKRYVVDWRFWQRTQQSDEEQRQRFVSSEEKDVYRHTYLCYLSFRYRQNRCADVRKQEKRLFNNEGNSDITDFRDD